MKFYAAYRWLVYIFIGSLFSSCGQKNLAPKSESELDLVAIANDTTMQNTIEDSYEYVRDLPFQNKRVFSIVNGGYTGFKDVLITERKSISQYDTLLLVRLHDEQIVDAFLSDLDKNNEAEIHLISKKSDTKLLSDRVLLFVNNVWQERPLPSIPANLKPIGDTNWSIENDLLRYSFSIAEKDSMQPSGNTKIYYKLKNNIFTIEKIEAIL